MTEIQLRILFNKCQTETATPAEKAELLSLLNDPHNEEEVKGYIDLLLAEQKTFQETSPAVISSMLETIFRMENNAPAPVRRISFMQRWGKLAASIVVVLAAIAAIALMMNRNNHHQQPVIVQQPLDLPPGKAGAVLTLADGSQLVLDTLKTGLISSQQGVEVIVKNGQLAYHPTDQSTGEIVYNTMTTPKGRQFNLVLPDGSRVWLNAASALRYPTVFSGNERQVAITGEAYFEVVKDAKKPFKVSINGKAEVEVLGTSFNVNAYENEAGINTALIDGAVAVTALSDKNKSARNRVVLTPGQLARVAIAEGINMQPEKILVVNKVDIAKITAWKEGVFNFNGTRLEEVMRQLERWYDIKVVYEKDIPNIRFGGKMSRSLNLEELLKILEASEVKFRMEEGRRLVVLP